MKNHVTTKIIVVLHTVILIICFYSLGYGLSDQNLVRQSSHEKESDQLEIKLNQLASNEINSQEGRVWVIKAGNLKQQKYTSTFKKIAESTSITSPMHTITLDALRALYKTGEPKQYFIKNILNFEKNKGLGYYSAIVLAYEPDYQLIKLLNKTIKQAKKNNNPDVHYLENVVHHAVRVTGLSESFDKAITIYEKTSFLLNLLRFSTSDQIDPEFPTMIKWPSSVWVRARLFELSEQYPNEVATIIFEIDVRKRFEKDLALLGDKTYGQKEYREYVSNFICLKAKKALSDLVNNAQAQDTTNHELNSDHLL